MTPIDKAIAALETASVFYPKSEVITEALTSLKALKESVGDVESLKREYMAAGAQGMIDLLVERGLLQTQQNNLKPSDGLALLPLEPTKEMLDACVGEEETPRNRDFIRGCYVCMVNAYLELTKGKG